MLRGLDKKRLNTLKSVQHTEQQLLKPFFVSKTLKNKFMKLPFDPVKNGWHFPENSIAGAMGVKRSNGLCGGMSLAAVNYFRYGMNIPAINSSDLKNAPNRTGTVQINSHTHPVLDFILYSQFAVFESLNIINQKAVLPFPNTPECHHLNSIDNEFPKIKKAIDNGCFVKLGLRSLKEDYQGYHQTLVYGYDDKNYTLYMYDSNNPNEEVIAKSNGYRLVFSNGMQYSSYYLLMTLNPAIKSDLNAYDSSKNHIYNFAVKPPMA
jgi:hypothetical protein